MNLRDIYERCDVSNNGTLNPLTFEDFKAQITRWGQLERLDEITALVNSDIANETLRKMQIRIGGRRKALADALQPNKETEQEK